MARRKTSDNGSTAVLDPPEDGGIAAVLEPEEQQTETPGLEETSVDVNAPVQGPILEPQEIAVYQREHYEQICEVTTNVRRLQSDMEAAKRASKLAKDEYDDAAAALLDLIDRGPSIPGRKYAKRIRLTIAHDFDTELGENFLQLPAGEEFDVVSIDEAAGLVHVTVQGTDNTLAPELFEVIEWSTSPPIANQVPRVPSRIRLTCDVTSIGGDAMLSAGTEHPCSLDGDSVVIELLGKKVQLKPGEYEVIGTAAPVDPNGWRKVSIDVLKEHGVTGSVVEKLISSDIINLGELLDYQSDGTELTDIDGIGPETEAKIADAMVAFWGEHPEWSEAAGNSQ